MLSTVNQHKSKVTTKSVRSITLVSKAASRFSVFKTPELFHSKIAMCIAICMGATLTGCGIGNGATTRVDTATPPKPTVATTYSLKVQSPVLLHNAKVTVTDAATGAVLGQSIIQNGNDIEFVTPLTNLKSGHLIVITLSPVDSSSQYFDPMLKNQLGAMATLNKPLHALISADMSDKITKIDPFTEMVYERALIRSGAIDLDNPRLNALTISNLNSATTEIRSAFGTTSTATFAVLFNSPTNIAAMNLFSTTMTNSKIVNEQSRLTLIALAQLALFAQNNPTAQNPYLDFAMRGSLDLLDGDLDGMTIFGGDTAGTVQITNPILYSGITSNQNNDPDHNDLATFISINSNQRTQRGNALNQATTQYFNTLNASLPLTARTDTASLEYIQKFDYATFTSSYVNGFGYDTSTPLIISSRIGAGNFTIAFGLPTGIDSKQAIDASDESNRASDIIQLNGTYQSNNGCKLNIGYDGTIQLSQGAQTYQVAINRKFSDRLIRLSGNQYLLNATSADLTAPRFIQIRTIGAKVISADAGRSAQQVPMTLDTTELSCTF